MIDVSLSGRTILVVEDEYLLADDLCNELTGRDAIVIGPAGTVSQAQALLDDNGEMDGAILDINLRGEDVFVFADVLISRSIPFVFTTGYDASVIPERFHDVPRCEKPVRMAKVVDAVGRATQARAA